MGSKPKIVRVEEKPLEEREPPSESEYEFKEIFLPRIKKGVLDASKAHAVR